MSTTENENVHVSHHQKVDGIENQQNNFDLETVMSTLTLATLTLESRLKQKFAFFTLTFVTLTLDHLSDTRLKAVDSNV